MRRPRMVARHEGDQFRTISIGKPREPLSDMYARLLAASWKRLLVMVIAFYLGANLFFGLLYFSLDHGIDGARPGSFADAFFFSVQTLTTIGYGKLTPSGLAANILMTVETFIGFGFFAVVTGLLFSKFSRPTARVIFSEIAVIGPYDGKRHLMFRLANARNNRIVDAHLRVAVLLSETTSEGQKMRRFHDLALVRPQVPFLQLTWTAFHAIDAASPLHAMTPETLLKRDAEIVISLTGLDETMSQTIHARYSYVAEDIVFDALFADVMERTPDHRIVIDYTQFHTARSMPPRG